MCAESDAKTLAMREIGSLGPRGVFETTPRSQKSLLNPKKIRARNELVMARLLDEVLVIDVESTCWEKQPPAGQVSEIIEVGLTTLDVRTLERTQKFSFFVRPTRSEVGPFCTQLTSIKPEDVAEAPSLSEVCQRLKKEFHSKERLWASYGDYDRRQFERNCSELGFDAPFGTSHLNVKTLLAILHGWKHEVGMHEALEKLGLPLEGTHHRGGDDAWNIAALLAVVLKKYRGSEMV